MIKNTKTICTVFLLLGFSVCKEDLMMTGYADPELADLSASDYQRAVGNAAESQAGGLFVSALISRLCVILASIFHVYCFCLNLKDNKKFFLSFPGGLIASTLLGLQLIRINNSVMGLAFIEKNKVTALNVTKDLVDYFHIIVLSIVLILLSKQAGHNDGTDNEVIIDEIKAAENDQQPREVSEENQFSINKNNQKIKIEGMLTQCDITIDLKEGRVISSHDQRKAINSALNNIAGNEIRLSRKVDIFISKQKNGLLTKYRNTAIVEGGRYGLKFQIDSLWYYVPAKIEVKKMERDMEVNASFPAGEKNALSCGECSHLDEDSCNERSDGSAHGLRVSDGAGSALRFSPRADLLSSYGACCASNSVINSTVSPGGRGVGVVVEAVSPRDNGAQNLGSTKVSLITGLRPVDFSECSKNKKQLDKLYLKITEYIDFWDLFEPFGKSQKREVNSFVSKLKQVRKMNQQALAKKTIVDFSRELRVEHQTLKIKLQESYQNRLEKNDGKEVRKSQGSGLK